MRPLKRDLLPFPSQSDLAGGGKNDMHSIACGIGFKTPPAQSGFASPSDQMRRRWGAQQSLGHPRNVGGLGKHCPRLGSQQRNE
jgi:hypothetical protein